MENNTKKTNDKIDIIIELLNDLAEDMGNRFKQMEKGFKEQREYSTN
jgi:hypothetical protein